MQIIQEIISIIYFKKIIKIGKTIRLLYLF